MKINCLTSSQDFRDGHRQNFKRQGVRDLLVVMVAADFLVDYKMVGAIDNMQKSKPDGWKKSKADGQRNGMVVVSKSGENVQQTSKWVRCFICQGPH